MRVEYHLCKDISFHNLPIIDRNTVHSFLYIYLNPVLLEQVPLGVLREVLCIVRDF